MEFIFRLKRNNGSIITEYHTTNPAEPIEEPGWFGTKGAPDFSQWWFDNYLCEPLTFCRIACDPCCPVVTTVISSGYHPCVITCPNGQALQCDNGECLYTDCGNC